MPDEEPDHLLIEGRKPTYDELEQIALLLLRENEVLRRGESAGFLRLKPEQR